MISAPTNEGTILRQFCGGRRAGAVAPYEGMGSIARTVPVAR